MKIPKILSLALKLLEFREKTLSLERTLSLNLLEFSEKWWKNKPEIGKTSLICLEGKSMILYKKKTEKLS